MKATKNIQQAKQLDTLKASMHKEMQSLLDWWMQNMIDEENGGFYGRIDGHGQLDPAAEKGVILNTRILWTFAIAAREQNNITYKNIANRAWRYISEHFIDTLEGGVFWMLDHKGEPTQTKKQVYAQAFAVYAFTEYYRLTGNKGALDHAMEVFFLMERYSFDKEKGGYLEAFSRGWRVLEDVRLSQKDDNAVKTMNTHLHVLEAYTNLYRVHADKTVGKALLSLIKCFLDRFIHPKSYHLLLFFDEDWNSQSTMLSYGHDIEASWLLVEAAEVLQHEHLINKCQQLAVRMAEATLAEGIDLDGGCFYETVPGKHADQDKHWWPQAEAVVGFLNAYQISGDYKFFEAAQKSWAFILQHIKDVKGGEWHWMVSQDHQVAYEEDKAGPWKGPYHNVRACLEGMARLRT